MGVLILPPVGSTNPDEMTVPPRLVAVPMKVPLKTGRAIGCAVGVMVVLPMTIAGAPMTTTQ